MTELGSVEKGKLGELYVFSKLIEKGAMPFLPVADIHGVDAIIRRKDNTYVEIQIKTTWTKEMRGYFNVPKLDKYNPPVNLFIVGLIMDDEARVTEAWIIPCQEYIANSTKKYLGIGTGYSEQERRLREKLSPYREAWHLITG